MQDISTKLTLREIVSQEPRIERILDNIRKTKSPLEWHQEYARAKRAVTCYVGWQAKAGSPASLCSSEAYDLVIHEIVRRLDGRAWKRK